ncbi:MAG: TolC family protein [Nostoc sp. DedVER02]|uniref:TolC family protein n=1 Tax=unclassified Nostoc TaxID=2593658 RepID=UPI002AD5A693|nr:MULTISPECIES: TolC family protein [unclassified Nostoc]MDZ7989648.1 TolC family protein [Nostoc sp. DedVER02]MDZ8113384.1 TolC family protein [Nostoc sp. DedVER01b]
MSNYRYLVIAGIGCVFTLSDFAANSVQPVRALTQPQSSQTEKVPSQADSLLTAQSASPTPTLLDNLNPNPNSLQFPTKPEDVKIQATQPITLQQALELAQRNNRELQVSILTSERSRATLREAQAALYPNVSLNTDISPQQSASSQLSAELRSRSGIPSTEQAPSTTSSGAAQLSYNIYTSGSRSARIRAAEEQLRFDELDLERLSPIFC